MNGTSSWVSDLGNGRYKNPVLFADYSDPDVIRVEDTFYMTSSSFNCTPGLPVLKSRDLVNWTIIGHGIKNIPRARYRECLPGCGVWAPAIRFNNGIFYIVFPMPDEGLYVIETKNPEEGWSDPRLLLEGKGLIDPCPFWDKNGKAYIIHAYAFSRCGIKSKLRLIEVSADLKTVLDEGRIIVDAMGRLPTLEGPKMFKFDGKYYISAPVGGVSQGWQMVFRSDSLFGPYEEKTVLAQRGSPVNGPHQGALIDDIEGNWWFIHFQDYQPWGRIVHLQPVFWENGWPLPGVEMDEKGVGKPVLEYKKPATAQSLSTEAFVPADSDNFTGKDLGLQWQWNANHSPDWFGISKGKLILYPDELGSRSFHLYTRILTQKINSPRFNALVTMDFSPETEGEEAGICIAGLESARIGIRKNGDQLTLAFSVNDQLVQKETLNKTHQHLFVEMDEGGVCRFGTVMDHRYFYLGPRFRAVEGRWIGARFGLYCYGSKDSKISAQFQSVMINSTEDI